MAGTSEMHQAGGKDSPSVDAIFIGAGINSLGGAFLLARAGWRVLVVDRNDMPGGAIEGRGWTRDVADAFADRVLDLVEDHAPGLRDKILDQVIHTPKDLEALNPNLVGGDINAGSCHLDQFYGLRPFPRYPHHRMPIPGLYMCGGSTWPGAGAGTGSGVLVAQRMLEDNP